MNIRLQHSNICLSFCQLVHLGFARTLYNMLSHPTPPQNHPLARFLWVSQSLKTILIPPIEDSFLHVWAFISQNPFPPYPNLINKLVNLHRNDKRATPNLLLDT